MYKYKSVDPTREGDYLIIPIKREVEKNFSPELKRSLRYNFIMANSLFCLLILKSDFDKFIDALEIKDYQTVETKKDDLPGTFQFVYWNWND